MKKKITKQKQGVLSSEPSNQNKRDYAFNDRFRLSIENGVEIEWNIKHFEGIY